MLRQYQPCDEGDTACSESYPGWQYRDVALKNCSSEKTDELYEYYSSRNKIQGEFAKHAMCLDDEDLFIHGDPFSWSHQSSLEITFLQCFNNTESNNNFCESQETIDKYGSTSTIDIVMESEQVDLKNRTEPV